MCLFIYFYFYLYSIYTKHATKATLLGRYTNTKVHESWMDRLCVLTFEYKKHGSTWHERIVRSRLICTPVFVRNFTVTIFMHESENSMWSQVIFNQLCQTTERWFGHHLISRLWHWIIFVIIIRLLWCRNMYECHMILNCVAQLLFGTSTIQLQLITTCKM